MRFIYILLIGVILSGCVNGQSNITVHPDTLHFEPLEFTFPPVEKVTMVNGIKLYLREDHELPLVELTMLIEGGSIFDSNAKSGLSQFFAEVMETGGAGDLDAATLEAELEAMAADLTVYSSSYGYSIDLSLNREDLNRGFEILSKLVKNPRFDSDRIELVRKQMIESIRRKNDDPGSIAGRILGGAVNPNHPFGTFPSVQAVERFSREDLEQLHQRYFAPQNCWLAVSGDVDKGGIVTLLKRQFVDWQPAIASLPSFPPLPAVKAGKILLADKKIPQTTVLMGHQGISKDNPDVPALRVANYILGGGGFNSRLMREIRSNRGLAYSAYSYFQVGRELPELFIASTETKTASTVQVVTLMQQLIEQIRNEPVTLAELELAQKSLINSFVFAFTDTHSVVSRKMRLDYYVYPQGYLEDYRQLIQAVTIADVQRVAQKYLHPDQLQIVLVGDSQQYREGILQLGIPVQEVDLNKGE